MKNAPTDSGVWTLVSLWIKCCSLVGGRASLGVSSERKSSMPFPVSALYFTLAVKDGALGSLLL